MLTKKIKFAEKDVIEEIKEFVNIASKYPEDVDIVSGRYLIDAKSIMGLFSLDASSELTLMIHNDKPENKPQLDRLLNSLERFIIS